MQDISINEFLSRKEETPVLQDARKFPNVKEYFLHNVAQWQQEVNK